MSHQQSFSYKGTDLPGLNQYEARINVLAQGHNAVTPVRLEPAALRSRVKHSTTEPLRSQKLLLRQQIAAGDISRPHFQLHCIFSAGSKC